MTRILHAASTAALWLGGVCMVVMVAIVAWAVFGRFVLNDTPAWAEQVAMLLLGWVILGAAAAGVRENTHMGFDILRTSLPERVGAALALTSDAVVTGFGACMVWFGTELAEGVWDATLPTTGLPGGVEYIPLIAGGALITLFGAERVVCRLRGLPLPEPAHHLADG